MLAAAVAAALGGSQLATARTGSPGAVSATGSGQKQLENIKHFVVIYEENHSFDNLYGGWRA